MTFLAVDDGTPTAGDSETVSLNVGDVNRPPVFAPVGNHNASVSAQLRVQVSASDPDGGLVSLAAKQKILLDPTERALLEAMARALNERCRVAVGFGVAPVPLPALSERELECLRWAAGGKTDWEIGELLGVSKSTAHFHIEQAKKKLGVNSRIQAVALLGLHGLV